MIRRRIATWELYLRRHGKYLKKYAFAWDFRVGLAIGVATLVASVSDKQLRESEHLLDVCAVLGVAILAVVMAAISIFAVFLTEDYGTVLRVSYPEDVGEAFYPYQLIAFVSCLTTLVAGFGLFVWPASEAWARDVVVAASVFLASWATLGTFSLVHITAGHGVLKIRTPELDRVRLQELLAQSAERKKVEQ